MRPIRRVTVSLLLLTFSFSLTPHPALALRPRPDQAGFTYQVLDQAVVEREQFAGLAVLAEMMPGILIDRGGEATYEVIVQLMEQDVRSVDYYGSATRTKRFESLAHSANISKVYPHLPGEETFRQFPLKLLANVSKLPEATVGERVDIERLAAWLEQAA